VFGMGLKILWDGVEMLETFFPLTTNLEMHVGIQATRPRECPNANQSSARESVLCYRHSCIPGFSVLLPAPALGPRSDSSRSSGRPSSHC